MKKLFVLIVLFFLMISSSFALSLDDVTGMFTSNIMNKRPEVNLNTPSNNHIYPSNIILVSWSYSDADGDEQEAYLIEISEDYQFSSPEYIGGTDDTTSKKVKIRKGEGDYYIRVMVKDAYEWSERSNVRGFYVDLSEKKCSDGTDFWKCSDNVPFYCDGGTLIEDCSVCGCDINTLCQPSGRCYKLTCNDGTGYGMCSKNKPSYCQAGNLINICSLCGCPSSQSCQTDGSCGSVILVTGDKRGTMMPLSLLERIALFFKKVFGQ